MPWRSDITDDRLKVDGAIPSPNIWKYPTVYEIENHAVDPEGVIEQLMRAERTRAGATVLDIGCGTGYHLPRFASEARRLVGVEPHHDLVTRAQPLPDHGVDVAHTR